MPSFCSRFPSLTSLSVCLVRFLEAEKLFSALSHLPQLLVHLKLELCWGLEEENQSEEKPMPPTQLPSVRALDLPLDLRSHSQLQLLNLSVTLPRLQAIHLWDYNCGSCGVDLAEYLRYKEYRKNSDPSFSTTLECLCATFSLLPSGVSCDRIICDSVNYQTLFPRSTTVK